jgi:hypothetical protein
MNATPKPAAPNPAGASLLATQSVVLYAGESRDVLASRILL